MKILISTLSGRVYGGSSYYKNLLPEMLKINKLDHFYVWAKYRKDIFGEISYENLTVFQLGRFADYVFVRVLFEQLVIPIFFIIIRANHIFYGKNIGSILFAKKNIIAVRNVEPFFYHQYDNSFSRKVISYLRLKTSVYFLRKSFKIVAVSNYVKNLLVKKFSVPQSKIEVIYNGSNIPSNYESIWRYNGNDNYFIIISKFIPYANQINLIHAYFKFIKKISENIPKLIFVGGVYDKKYYDEFLQLNIQYNLENYILHLGYVTKEKVYQYSSKAITCIHPSKLEACPHSLIEMMSIGVPVICSNEGPMEEIMENAGIYFDPDNIDNICHALLRAYENKNLLNEKSKNGIERSKKFNWSLSAIKYVNFFHN